MFQKFFLKRGAYTSGLMGGNFQGFSHGFARLSAPSMP